MNIKCRPIRSGDQMQCACGLAWDLGEDKPDCQPKVAHPNGNPKFSPSGMLLDETGNRSIFDDVDE